jgi:membrane-bound lytic murein transglycosylase D
MQILTPLFVAMRVRQLHCSSVQEITEMNGLSHHRIRVGQQLKVPVCR